MAMTTAAWVKTDPEARCLMLEEVAAHAERDLLTACPQRGNPFRPREGPLAWCGEAA